MRVVFRADASLQIGTGHIMRCLALADALKAQGAECQFISREHSGNLIDHLRSKGYDVHALPAVRESRATEARKAQKQPEPSDPAHLHWLGVTQRQDADECAAILNELKPDWLIIDHYALDARWEAVLKPYYAKLMVIDDLADRPHLCDLLLDQTFGRDPDDYKSRVPPGCNLLCGAQYALLRPEFAALRPYSLKRRQATPLDHLLVSMGGIDKDNATGQVLEAFQHTSLPLHCRITVVMGARAPWLDVIRQQAEQLPWFTEVRVSVNDMAQLMADSDLAIGAAGSTSWERCCLGVPTVMVVLADNQREVAVGLERSRAAQVLQGSQQIAGSLPAMLNVLVSSPFQRAAMSHAASLIADGSGLSKVIGFLEQ
nr:UDP-2,4-diacetamido-2,4,6-trideoxy-beta-L-altropyranose hydrolase [uncultured Pseudomonas sp.]